MIELPVNLDDDDPEFMQRTSSLINGVLQTVRPRQVFVSRVDQWFDKKWLGFSCKVLGALGLHLKRLTLPPFHPHRITWQRHYHGDVAGGYEYDGMGLQLAIRQNSASNKRRVVASRQLSSSVLVWFSGSTKKLGRGCLMVYYSTPSERPSYSHTQDWYLGISRDPAWRIVQRKLISDRELVALAEAGSLHTIA